MFVFVTAEEEVRRTPHPNFPVALIAIKLSIYKFVCLADKVGRPSVRTAECLFGGCFE